MSRPRRIAILGGTFDPIHRGHLDPVLEIRPAFEWDEIILMPASVQPFKREVVSASPFHRYAMAVLATASLPDVRVSPMELERGLTSYTVETLEQLRMVHPRASLEWIIGDDNLDGLVRWKSLDHILELANLVILRRSGKGSVPEILRGRISSIEERKMAGTLVMAGNAIVPISATIIREKLRQGQSIDDLVPLEVARHVKRYSLYD